MSLKSVITLRLELKPSHLYSRLVVSLHVLACAACLYNALPFALRMLGIAALALSLIRTRRQNRGTARHVDLNYSDANGWSLRDGEAQMSPISLSASTLNTPWMVLLHYRTHGRRDLQTLPIFCDALTVEDFRKLRVALRINAIN